MHKIKEMSNYDVLVKLLFLGDSGVGKSSIMLQYCDHQFSSSYISTIGIDFKIKTIELNKKKIKLQLWDTAGQERFRTITTSYYIGAMGMLIVYDVTDAESFYHVRTWMNNIYHNAKTDVQCVLIANKCDLNADRVISKEQGEKMAEEFHLKLFETSAKSTVGIEEAFLYLVAQIVEKEEEQQYPLSPLPPSPVSERSCCILA